MEEAEGGQRKEKFVEGGRKKKAERSVTKEASEETSK